MIRITKKDARKFLVRSHMLDGRKQEPGRKNILKILKYLRAVQVDSIDVCGTNQEIVFSSRVDGFRPAQLDEILYGKNRKAYEAWSKCLCILPLDSFPFYYPNMLRMKEVHGEFLEKHDKTIKWVTDTIRKNGPMASSDFDDDQVTDGWWSGEERLVKRALDILWQTGRLMIHHRKRRIRCYDLTERCIHIPEKVKTLTDYETRGIEDRLHAMRLFRDNAATWNLWQGVRLSDRKWLETFTGKKKIVPVEISGSTRDYFILKKDLKLLDATGDIGHEVRLLAPLDSMLWDRDLVRDIFSFVAKFEVYHPPKKRTWGYYCLPVLYGSELAGRVDLARYKKKPTLNVISVHWEDGVKVSNRLAKKFARALRDHAEFLGLEDIRLPDSGFDGKKMIAKHLS